MQQKIDDTIARLNGMDILGYTIGGMQVDEYLEDSVRFILFIETPIGIRFMMKFNVSNKAIENDKFDLYDFMFKKIINAVMMINKKQITVRPE